VQVRSFPGHTGGDSVVFVPDAKVAFGGDLLWHRAMPNLMDASIKPWIETVGSLVRNFSEYSFVPGHGDVGAAADVRLFREYLALLLKLVEEARSQGKAGEALIATVGPGLAEQYGGYEYFEFAAPRNILDVEAELNGTKKNPQPVSES
jgi:glyoxylase-like metal-dependent hydrolase (beta-lactamase superfamily II)